MLGLILKPILGNGEDMNLQKQITTGFGITAEYWDVNNVTIVRIDATHFKAVGNLSLYYNQAAFDGGSDLLDNAKFSFNDLTDADLDGNTRAALVSRIRASNLVDGEERNIYTTSHSGSVSFQDAVIV